MSEAPPAPGRIARSFAALTNKQKWRAFRAALWRGKWILLLILAIVFLIHATHLVKPIELPVLDRWQSLLGRGNADYVRLIAIDQADFEQLFEGRTPLKPDVLAQLLDVIARAKPRAIGVDIRTSAPEFSTFNGRAWGPVVWARDAVQNEDVVEPTPVLGGGTPVPPARAGIAVALADDDAAIRRIPRTVETAAGPRATFHWAVINAACESGLHAPGCADGRPALDDATHNVLVSLYRRRLQMHPISASALLDMGRRLGPASGPDFLRDRVVLIGGTYHASRDFHKTPIGEMSGVEVWAHAIETELAGEGVEDISALWLTAADAAVALLMIWLHTFVGGKRAFLLMILVVPLTTIVLSFVLFRAAGLMLTFGPIVLGILLHQLWDDYRQSGETAQHA